MDNRTKEILNYIYDNKRININELKKEFNEEKDLEYIKDVIFALAQNDAIINLKSEKFQIDLDKLEDFTKKLKLYSLENVECTINSVIDEYDKKTRLEILEVLEDLLEEAILFYPEISILDIKVLNFSLEPTFKVKDSEKIKSYDPITDLVMEFYINDIFHRHEDLEIKKVINLDKIESAINYSLNLKVGKSDFYKVYQEILKKKGKFNALEIFYNNNLIFSEGKIIIDYLISENKIKYIDEFIYEVIDPSQDDNKIGWRSKSIKAFFKMGFNYNVLTDDLMEITLNKNEYIVEVTDTSIVLTLTDETKSLIEKYNDAFVKYLTDNTYQKKDIVPALLKMNENLEFELNTINEVVNTIIGLDEFIGIVKTKINNKR